MANRDRPSFTSVASGASRDSRKLHGEEGKEKAVQNQEQDPHRCKRPIACEGLCCEREKTKSDA